MSRNPNPFPFIPLQVTATPISQFAAPEVRQKSTGNLIALANALASIDPKVNNIIERRADAAIRQSVTAGQVAAAKFKNLEAFKAAVDRGEIDEAANPHFSDALK